MFISHTFSWQRGARTLWNHRCLSGYTSSWQSWARTLWNHTSLSGYTCSWKAEQGLSETIYVYQGIHFHDKAEQGFSETTETIDVYQSYMFMTKMSKDSLKPQRWARTLWNHICLSGYTSSWQSWARTLWNHRCLSAYQVIHVHEKLSKDSLLKP